MDTTTDFAAFRASFFAVTDASEHIVITSHFSPDDDSIGSVLSMHTILTTKYPAKDIRILYTGQKVDRYSCFTGYDQYVTFVPDIATELGGADLLIMLDGSSFRRFSKMPEALQVNAPKTIAIDHHAGEPDAFTLALVMPTFSSNCELLYTAFDAEPMLNKTLAEYFLLGIVGDTGNFAFVKPSQSAVFLIAKTLVEMVGVSIDSFRSRYGAIPQRIIPLLQELVKNTAYQSMPHWPDFQYTYIDRATMVAGGYSDDEMSAASHIYSGQYMTRVQGYVWGFIVTPRNDGGARISSRSLATGVNVREIHERMGIGSGHDRAAGGDFKKAAIDREPKQCIVEVLEWMKDNTPLAI